MLVWTPNGELNTENRKCHHMTQEHSILASFQDVSYTVSLAVCTAPFPSIGRPGNEAGVPKGASFSLPISGVLVSRVVLHGEGEIELQKQPMLVWNVAS